MRREDMLKMLLHPEQYTDEQMDEMLNDANISTPDAEAEWERLAAKRRQNRKPLIRWAAVFIGVLMLSGMTYAAIQMVRSSRTAMETAQQETVATDLSRQQADVQPNDSTDRKPVVFEDVELETILNEVATFYQVEPVFKNEASKHIRLYFTWDKKKTLDDIIETFNKFDRIHITRYEKILIIE